MPVLVLKSAIFDTMEGVFAMSDPTLDFSSSLDTLAQGDLKGSAKVLQLSANLIRFSQDIWDHSGDVATAVTFEVRLSGSGIKPVSNIDALFDAINDGLATGTLTKLDILTGGSSILTLTLDQTGYHLTSGDVAVNLTGTLPLTFSQFYDLADLFEKVASIESMTRAERLALFDDLSAYSISGLSLTEAGQTLFAVHVDATTASLTLGGLTMTAKGSFPDNLGEDVQLLWDLYRTASNAKGFSAEGVAALEIPGLSVTGLVFTDAAGHLLGRMADPLTDTPLTLKVDGKLYDDVQVGGNFNEDLFGNARDKVVLAGLGGRDYLEGGLKTDYLIGGSGNDTMKGFEGADRLDGGTGRDVMTGGTGADVFHFDLGDGIDRIEDFVQREDKIQILDAARLSDLTFTQVGDDVQLDYRSIHILVADITVAQLDLTVNFLF